MPIPIVSPKKAQAIFTALILVGFAILAITEVWWPGIMLVIGIPLAIRQYLLQRPYDMCITLLVFIGTFITVEYDLSWRIFLPILFCLGALYILIREFIAPENDDEQK